MEIDAMSVKEIKVALVARGVNYAGCIEKSELVALLRANESSSPADTGGSASASAANTTTTAAEDGGVDLRQQGYVEDIDE
eukprot:2313641-Prymnesium_polylepis.2